MNFPHKLRLARVIRTRADKEGVLSIAKAIYETHLKGIGNFRSAIPVFLNVCYTIDLAKVEAIGRNAPTDISNRVQLAVGHLLLLDTQWDEKDANWLNDEYSVFEAHSDHSSRWGATKLAVLYNAMTHIMGTRWFADASNIMLTDEQVRLAESEFENIKAHIREMMERLMELRRYGVKASFTRQGFIPQSNQAWVMWDFRDFAGPLNISQKDTIAQVAFATEASQIKNLRLEASRSDHVEMLGFALPFPASFGWTMGRDGRLDISHTTSSLPVEDIFRSRGKELLYQAVQMRLMYHLYDLIVPVAKLATLPSMPTLKAGHLRRITNALGLLKKDPVVDLYLPRLRLIEDRKEIVEALEQEIEQSVEETKRASKRRHDVEDFIRPLPKGHRPSATARALAREAFGIELPDNKTYVRRHERGKGEKITAHRAVKMG